MFYEGDLQSGIALALQESKHVACFLKGEDEQSSRWENNYLNDRETRFALSKRAVTLRIIAGSQEASYLSAYYPVPVVPALIIIHNGQLLLDIRSGEAKDTFKAAVLKTLVDLSADSAPASNSASASSAADTTINVTEPVSRQAQAPTTRVAGAYGNSSSLAAPDESSQTVASAGTSPRSDALVHSNASSSSDSSSNRPSETVQNLLAERRRRLEIDKKEKEAAEKADRKAKADARQAAMTAAPNSAKAKQANYAHLQRKRQQEAKLEKERILKQIEHDRVERKEKEEQRRALAKAEAETKMAVKDGAGGLVDQQLSGELNNMPRSIEAKVCAIQVRMFDGSTIRNRFPSDQTLRMGVRPWVDKERLDGDFPYVFKQILAPLPNRTLSISDEEESLQSLRLTPSATLVMVPVGGYTTAYSSNQGIISKGAAAGYNVVASGAGLVSGALGTLLRIGQSTTGANMSSNHESIPQPVQSSHASGQASGTNVRTLGDQHGNQEDHQLYNGNQVSIISR